jgi:hypothetical protein
LHKKTRKTTANKLHHVKNPKKQGLFFSGARSGSFPPNYTSYLGERSEQIGHFIPLTPSPPLVAYGGAADRLLAVGLILPALAVIN